MPFALSLSGHNFVFVPTMQHILQQLYSAWFMSKILRFPTKSVFGKMYRALITPFCVGPKQAQADIFHILKLKFNNLADTV